MQPEFAVDKAELSWGDQPPMRHAHPVERAIEVSSPEIQEVDKLREVGRQVVSLPDVALQ